MQSVIFAFVEGGTLEVYDSAADAIRQYEGVDAEDGVVHFYDASGTYLEPRFIIPNRRGKILGLFGWVQSGTYELVPNSTTEEDPFPLALYETQVLEPNKWFANLAQLKSALSAKGVQVEYVAKKT